MREPEPFPSCELCESGGIASRDCPNCGPKASVWYINEVFRLKYLVRSLREDVKKQNDQEFDDITRTMLYGSPQGKLRNQVEKLKALNKSLEGALVKLQETPQVQLQVRIEELEALNKNFKDANQKWTNEADKLQAYLKSIGSDGSIYSSVFDEAIALLDHFKLRCKETPQCNGQNS